MDKKYKFPIIPHTHWDREWYFTTSKSIIYSLTDFDEVMDVLENDMEFPHFLLDAQTSIVDDYLEFHPEDEGRIRKLVSEDKLIIGPWYTQTDQLVISGESIVRNLYYGIERATELGKSMMVGYMPDSFGQTAQMPQILNGFNIYKNTFKRGIKAEQYGKNEYYWESEDGSRVFNCYLDRYGNFVYFTREEESLRNLIGNLKKETDERSRISTLTLFNGEDQRPIRKNLPEIIKKMQVLFPDCEFKISTVEKVLEEMENEDIEYDTVKGEMTSGEYSRIHKSIFSNRADLKIMNNKTENLITNISEPLSSVAYKLGLKYETKVFEKVWKLMCENAAHDSSGMCNSDNTNSDIWYRFKRSQELMESLNEINMRIIGMKIPEKDIFQFQVYNLLPYKNSGIMELEIFTPSDKFSFMDTEGNKLESITLSSEEIPERVRNKMLSEVGFDGNDHPKWVTEDVRIFSSKVLIYLSDIPAMGYKTLLVKKEEEAYTGNALLETKDTVIENDILRVEILKNGEVNIQNKKTNQTINGSVIFENSGDDGDTYDYSEPRKDWYLYSNKKDIRNLKVKKSDLVSTVNFTTSLEIPKNLAERENKAISMELDIHVEIKLEKNSDLVKVDVELENNSIEHRVRVLFKTGIPSEFSIADQQFGSIKRPTYLKEVENWRENGWNEKPRTIEPMQSFVTLKNENNGVVVFTDCVREYQIVGDELDTIALTLFRSVPMMGKAELKDRPGRASGMPWPTPDAQLLKKMNFNFAVKLYSNDEKINDIAVKAKEYLTPFIGYQAAHFKNVDMFFLMNQPGEKDLPFEYSLFEFMGNNTVLSTVKKCEREEGLIVRLFNPDFENTADETIVFSEALKDVKEVKFDEKTVVKELSNESNIKLDNIAKCHAVSVRIK